MDIVTPVTFAEVLAAYLRDHPVERTHEANSNPEGVESLERADQLKGGWWHVRLSRADVLGVVLPWHLSEGGARELVPRTGLTVAEAAGRIRSDGPPWYRANPVCAAKLALLEWAPFTPVFLSTSPMDHSDYSDLLVREGLIHIDGLHRMISWELVGRLPEGAELDAFVSGTLPDAPPTDPRQQRPRAGTEDEQA
ncbi:DUF6309 family protein [Streptomyces sp. NPDC127068]|uniref:DUF6309 family protein n=1 Tax=Streptomyces sp. NPDC127068 TaxID=3347127 RepID=UPI00364C9A67